MLASYYLSRVRKYHNDDGSRLDSDDVQSLEQLQQEMVNDRYNNPLNQLNQETHNNLHLPLLPLNKVRDLF
jgi:hypothetical protein